MSPRAACRLETLGFAAVYDYVPGKVDWLAHGLPVEGNGPEPPTAGQVTRTDVARCGLEECVGEVRERIGRSPYTFALVLGPDDVLLGRLPSSVLEGDPARRVGELMEEGPSTVRPHVAAGNLARRLATQNLRWAIVTDPEGRFIGVAARSDLESLAGA